VASIRDTIRGLTSAPTSLEGKAGSYRADHRGSSALFGSGAPAGSGPFSARAAKTHLGAYAGRDAIDLVFGCCNVIAETTSAAGYKLETEGGKELPLERSEADDNARLAPRDLIDLLKKPNPWQTWDDLIEELVIDYILTGDFFVYKYGVEDETGIAPGERPVALYRLPPDRITVLTGEEVGRNADLIGGYRYEVPGRDSDAAIYQAEDVIQLRRPNVHSPYRGAGIVAGSPTLFDLELALMRSKEAYFRNGARLSGVLETDRSVPDNLSSKLKREFNGLFAGPAAAGMTAVLSAGVKYRTIQSNAQESELTPITEQTAKRLMSMFRVPRAKLGMEPGADPGEERREFANGMMRPLLNRIENIFTDRLTMPGWGIKFCIEYEYQMPIEEQIKLAGTYGTLPGITIREVREKANLPRLTELMEDEAKAKKIEEVVLNLPGQNDNASSIKDRNLPGEPGRPPDPAHTSGVTPAGANAEADAEAAKRRELAGA
jgi:HK97 family phage portal protein